MRPKTNLARQPKEGGGRVKEIVIEIISTSIGMVIGIFIVFFLIWMKDQFVRFINYLKRLDEE